MKNPALTSGARTRSFAALLAVSLIAMIATAAAASQDHWTDRNESSITARGSRHIIPDAYRTVQLDQAAMQSFLAGLPSGREAAGLATQTMSLPMPDGSFARFEVHESPVMHPDLQARYPMIRTYAGLGIDDPTATVRFDLTPHGFHAAILSAEQSTVYIDPFQRGDVTHYISYYTKDYSRTFTEIPQEMVVGQDDPVVQEIRNLIAMGEGSQVTGQDLRTYLTVVAATGEYTTFHGATVMLGQAAIVTAMNRVNGIYVREVSAFMELHPNNDSVVYTNAATDPYTNNNGFTMLNQNQANLDAVFGSGGYDLGHVFSTGGGGVAGLAVLCRSGQKARGVTGLFQPIGDVFYVDFVAHEIGHQYGANHSFNGSSGACSGGNRNASTAYEPGSGSTIMAYAGICSGQNIQGNSDDYMHTISFQEIITYIENGFGNICATTTATGNSPPVSDAGSGGFFIPKETPFELTGSATDPNGNPLTYCWEQFDLGPAGHPNSPVGNAPIFRSFDPVTTPSRSFPKLTDVLFNNQSLGEILPTYTRDLTFRLTARDNLGGVDWDQIAFDVDGNSGPFEITNPNAPGIVWPAGSSQNVTWNVANTNNAPVNSQLVDIELSVNSGFDFTLTLATGVPNDGSHTVVVPNTPTFFARIKVSSADNVFYDINDNIFEISGTAAIEDVAAGTLASRLTLHGNQPNPFNPSTSISFDLPASDHVTLKVYDLAGRSVTTLIDGTLEAGTHSMSWDGTYNDGRAAASGVYLYQVQSSDATQTRRMVLLK